MDFDSTSFDLPYGLERFSSRAGVVSSDLVKNYGTSLEVAAHRWERWVVKLAFEKRAVKGSRTKTDYGNGFYVNLPSKTFDVILTAGHNLVETPNEFYRSIRIVGAGDEPDIPVTPDMMRVSQQYLAKPEAVNQIYDYGAILLPRNPARPPNKGFGFGFNLILGLSPAANSGHDRAEEKDILLDREVSITGYKPEDDPKTKVVVRGASPGEQRVEKGHPPRRANGDCVDANEDQLWYKGNLVGGISGSPVWLGFRGVETVVGIHNYGKEKDAQGQRACRLNLNIWADVFGWAGLGWGDIYLSYAGSPIYSMHLHIDAPPDGDPDFARVRVGKPGVVETRLTVIPVSSPPDALYEDSCFGFLHCPNTAKATAGGSNVGGSPGLSAADLTALKAEEPQQWWLQWWAKTETVSFSRQFDGRCEVQMKRLAEKPNEPFGISVRLNGQNWMHLAMEMDLLEG